VKVESLPKQIVASEGGVDQQTIHRRRHLLHATRCLRPGLEATMDSRFLSRLRDFDAYPKTMQDYQVRTVAGAGVSITG